MKETRDAYIVFNELSASRAADVVFLPVCALRSDSGCAIGVRLARELAGEYVAGEQEFETVTRHAGCVSMYEPRGVDLECR